MADVISRSPTRAAAVTDEPTRQAYQLLHVGFVLAPAIAGADKFLHLLTNWDQYLAPAFARALPMSGHNFMLLVGAIELVAALIVLFAPRVGAYVVACWLAAIIVDLFVAGGYYDIALRDFGLLLAALALGRLARHYEPPAHREPGGAPERVTVRR